MLDARFKKFENSPLFRHLPPGDQAVVRRNWKHGSASRELLEAWAMVGEAPNAKLAREVRNAAVVCLSRQRSGEGLEGAQKLLQFLPFRELTASAQKKVLRGYLLSNFGGLWGSLFSVTGTHEYTLKTDSLRNHQIALNYPKGLAHQTSSNLPTLSDVIDAVVCLPTATQSALNSVTVLTETARKQVKRTGSNITISASVADQTPGQFEKAFRAGLNESER